jgi:putative colanic acid biosynthesis acetyltransferase WcaF
MARELHYNAAEHIAVDKEMDPYLLPAFSFQDRLKRQIWNICWLVLFRPSPRPMHAWRAMLLRVFGAKLGVNCHIYPRVRIWSPWNLICDDAACAGDGAELYNPAPLRLGSHAIVSQDAYICGATHDFNDPAFPQLAYSMTIGPYAWICARSSVCPGVNVGEGAVLGLGSVATRDLEPWGVYAGVPAVKVKERNRAIAGKGAEETPTL